MAEWNSKANDVFLRAAVVESPAERQLLLDQQCADDVRLRAQVESLLAASAKVGSFLDKPVIQAPTPNLGTADYRPIAERPGTVLGPYKLMEQIGEGGMGLVFVAEQQHPVRRKVALKIIKPGLDSQQVIARFEAERQALALMDHQNIAKVFDAGTTESGRPYFVMELVHGVPITQYCDANKLPPRKRLALFLPVCHAIQHAHQKGIIHRDIKPSNILVTMYDDKAVPKVIDFGVAKAIEQRLTEKTVYTQFGTLVGTFEYMSPEQAEMNAFGVDTRSDVYALGVLLYELLTGTTPLERHRLREAAYADIVRLIKEEEPPPPSTRLSSSGAALTGISQQRGSAPGKLTELVRGELDWIVMRCLEKDRTRRYETANGLARDVERYLKDEPVEACPPTAGYKIRKFARKNRKLLATAAGFVVLLVLGVAGSAWQAVRATQAETVALANEQKANASAVQAQEKEQEANQQRNEAQRQRDEAQHQRDEVRALNEKLQATQTQLRSTLYAAHMNLAQHAWEEGDVPRVLEMLDMHGPRPGELDLRGFEWHYLNRLCHPDHLLTLKCGGMPVFSAVFSKQGTRVLTVNMAGFIHRSGRPERVDPELKVWDALTGQEIQSFTLKRGGRKVVFSPDAKRLASVSDIDQTLKVWDAQTGQELLSLVGVGSRRYGDVHVVFSPNGQRLASPSGPEVKVWDAITGQELPTLKGHIRDVTDFAFSPDGSRLVASAEKDRMVKVWDVTTGGEILSLEGQNHEVNEVVFCPDGKRLASVSSGWDEEQAKHLHGEVKVWDAQTGQELFSIEEQRDGFDSVAFSPDGKRLATASANSENPHLKVWDAQTGQLIFTFQRHTSHHLAFSPDSKQLAGLSSDGTLEVWDLQTGQEIRTLKGQTKWASELAFSPDGKHLAIGGGGGEVKIWDWHAAKDPESLTLKGIFVPSPWFDGVRSVVFSRDLMRVAGSSWNMVKIWDARNGRVTLNLKGHTQPVRCLAFSQDGKRLASGDGFPSLRPDDKPIPGIVKVWDAQTGQELHSFPGHAYGVFSVALSPDGKRLASTSADNAVKVWDLQTGKEFWSIPPWGQVNTFSSVSFSPNGKRLAGVEPGRGAKIWDAQTGQELLSIKTGGHCVDFSPDGKRLAYGGKVWDAQTGQELFTPRGGFGGVAFSQDGKRLARSAEGGVRIWDAQTGQETLSLKAPTDPVACVAFSPDGHRLGYVSVNGTVKFWDATPLPEKP